MNTPIKGDFRPKFPLKREVIDTLEVSMAALDFAHDLSESIDVLAKTPGKATLIPGIVRQLQYWLCDTHNNLDCLREDIEKGVR